MENRHTSILVTGSAGFIGYHLCKHLLECGHHVYGIDAITDYYDPQLKMDRLKDLRTFDNFFEFQLRIENTTQIIEAFKNIDLDIIIHLAAQAGVRYSIDHPKDYVQTNLVGTFSILELARKKKVSHLLAASTSSVYGSNTEMPFSEDQKTNSPLSFYAATKKSNEVMAHSYSHIHRIPITMFRFFTVYGPWGRPDMALFKFTDNILQNKPIDIYNYGEMSRDFTYIDDLVQAIVLLKDQIPPEQQASFKPQHTNDSLSTTAPWRVVNIGNSQPQSLMKYINTLEDVLNVEAKKNYLPIQPGDVPSTWADNTLLQDLTGFKPKIGIEKGVFEFVTWYKKYYEVET